MPFALIIVGVVLLVSSVKNTQDDLFTLVKGDFTGQQNYLYWMVSILIIGAVGYIPTLKPLSRIFLVLLIIVLFLSHGGILQQFNQQLFGGSLFSSLSTGIKPLQPMSSIAGTNVSGMQEYNISGAMGALQQEIQNLGGHVQ